jgi:hypothetical protein
MKRAILLVALFQLCLAGLVAGGVWYLLFRTPDDKDDYDGPVIIIPAAPQEARTLEELAEKDPVAFLQRCLDRYEKDVTGYTCIFEKQERVKGTLRQKEKIKIHFNEKPFSVHMDWKKGWDALGARRTLFVEGKNDGLLIARALHHDFGPILVKKLDDPQVTATSRFGINEFGMYKGARSTMVAMRKAKERGELHVKYEGIVQVKEAGDRPCYKLVRTPYHPPEDDGCNELVIYIDKDTLLQVGSTLKDSDGKLIADYFFHDIHLNPTFTPEQFTKKAL